MQSTSEESNDLTGTIKTEYEYEQQRINERASFGEKVFEFFEGLGVSVFFFPLFIVQVCIVLRLSQLFEYLSLLRGQISGDFYPHQAYMVSVAKSSLQSLNQAFLTSPFITSRSPSWVPASILRSFSPHSVQIFFLAPRAAWEIEIHSVDSIFWSTFLNFGCLSTITFKCRSPLGPFQLWFPYILAKFDTFYLKVSLSLFSIPAGISRSSSALLTLIPVALHSVHGCLITSPIPLHREHYKCITMELCLQMVEPEPPHARHRVGAEPGWHRLPLQEGQVPFLQKTRFILAPFMASSKAILTYFWISSPLLLLDEPAEQVS